MSTKPVQLGQDEDERLKALQRYAILDTPPESAYDDVTRLARSICDTPIALITLVDRNRQWFKSAAGFKEKETPRDIAFCSQAIEGDDTFVVQDAAKDSRFRNNPLVTGTPNIGFYAGAPLITPDGYRIGTVCVIDDKPRTLSTEQLEALRTLSQQVVANLELRRTLKLTCAARDALAEEIEHSATIKETRRIADSTARARMSSVADNIAIIRQDGEIVHVNDAWSSFADNNCAPEMISRTGKGVNYLEICDRARQSGCEEAGAVAKALRNIFAGASESTFSLEYPCHAPNEKRWFVMQVSAFASDGNCHAVIAHRNVTARKFADEQNAELGKSLEQRVEQRTKDLEKAYAGLRSSDERLRSLFENASVGVVVGDMHGCLLRVNDAYLSLTGLTREQLLGRSILDHIDPADRPIVAERLRSLAESQSPWCDIDLRSGGSAETAGQWRHISLTAVRDAGGAVTQFMGLVQDRHVFKESELQANMVFNRSRDMMVVADTKGHFLVVNEACTHILGYSTKQLTEMNYFDITHPDDLETARTELGDLARDSSRELLDVRMRTSDGEYRSIVWNAVKWTTPGLFLGVGRDLTSIRAAERAVREQGKMLQRAEQMAQIGSWQYEFATKSTHCSDGLQAIAAREVDSQNLELDELLSYVVAGDRDLLKQNIRAVVGDGIPRRIQCGLQRNDGSVRTVQTSIDVVRNSKGEVYGVIGACLDITDMNQTLERLRYSETQLRALARKLEQIREEERANISREIHDELGQMLTALKIDLTLLARDVSDPVAVAPGPEEIVSSLKSMENLVDTTIKSVRIIATQLRPEVLDAFGLVPAIQWHANEFERRTEIECEVDATTMQPNLSDEIRIALFRITQEAMTNVARHASASRITVSIAAQSDAVTLTVSDNGRGIDMEELFSTTSLGVMGMRERATMVGGTFDISGEPGRGTMIRVEVPLQQDTQGNQSPGRASA